MADEGEEKTLPPTERKLQKAREDGNVAHSPMLISAASTIAAVVFFWIVWPDLEAQLKALIFNATVSQTQSFELTSNTMSYEAMRTVIMATIPALILVMVVSILVNILDLKGFVFSTKPITPEFSKLNPAEGFKRIFGVRGMVESIQGLVKTSVFTIVAIIVIMLGMNALFQTPTCREPCVTHSFESLLKQLLILFIILLLIAAMFDLIIQRWLFKRDQKMTVSEMKREMKEMYGSPEVRGARKRLAREISQSATKMGAHNASVVVIGGDGAVVALRFVRNETPAPVVVAKGFGDDGRKIAGIAEDLGRKLYRDDDLAAGLLKDAPKGQFIPQAYFEKVAQVLVRTGALN